MIESITLKKLGCSKTYLQVSNDCDDTSVSFGSYKAPDTLPFVFDVQPVTGKEGYYKIKPTNFRKTCY
jgi:hypothetical protein